MPRASVPDAQEQGRRYRGYGKLTGPAKDGIHTVDVDRGRREKSQVQGQERAARHRLGRAHAARAAGRTTRILTNIEILSLNADSEIADRHRLGRGGRGVRVHLQIVRHGSHDSRDAAALVPVEDEEVSKELVRVYRKRGINGFVSAKIEKVEKTKDGVAVTFTVDGKQQTIEAEKVLVAVGRAPAHRERRHREDEDQARARLRASGRVDADGRAGHLRHRRHRRRLSATRARRARWKASSPWRTSRASRRSR